MSTIAIIQARMGSSRLPGKVMLPLNCKHVLDHVYERACQADTIDKVIMATSSSKQDDLIAKFANEKIIPVVRGSERNVLSRFHRAAKYHDPTTIVRITGDCPLLSPDCVDYAVKKLQNGELDYISCSFDMTFPRGLTAEAFTWKSFKEIKQKSSQIHHQEHVTPYYREHTDEFTVGCFRSDEVFSNGQLHNRTDIRLTLDEANDYLLLSRLYDRIDYEDTLSIQDAVTYIDEHGLSRINSDVKQKDM